MKLPHEGDFNSLTDSHEHGEECISGVLNYLIYVDNYAVNAARNLPRSFRASVSAYVRKPTTLARDSLSRDLSQSIVYAATSDPEAQAEAGILPQETALFNSLVFARILDEVKKKAIGIGSSTDAINGLSGRMMGEAGWSMPRATDEELDKIRHLADAATRMDHEAMLWYVPKISSYLNAIETRRRSEDLLDSISVAEGVDADALRADNDSLFDSINFLQKYEPKPCVAPAIPGAHNTSEWLVVPRPRELRRYRFNTLGEAPVSFIGSKNPIPSSETSFHRYANGIAKMNTINMPVAFDSYTAPVVLGKDGHLYSLLGQRWLDYVDDDHKAQYEQLRAELLCIYHDSVVPVYVTELVDQEIAGGDAETGQKQDSKDSAKSPGLRRLILARKLVMDLMRDEITEALENQKTDAVDGEQKGVARHDVVGHIRRLPKNWRASPEAREACFEDIGIVLAEYGETYVRGHERGSLDNPAQGHKAVFQAGKMATATGIGEA
jgi:hypothetical protein